jgi:hypothetical protein
MGIEAIHWDALLPDSMGVMGQSDPRKRGTWRHHVDLQNVAGCRLLFCHFPSKTWATLALFCLTTQPNSAAYNP